MEVLFWASRVERENERVIEDIRSNITKEELDKIGEWINGLRCERYLSD